MTTSGAFKAVKRVNPQTMSIDQLIARFAEIGVAQDYALLGRETARYNRLFDQMHVVVEELKGRPGDERRALLKLYDHPNMQVRLRAAVNSMAIAPVAARQMLENIKASNWDPQSGAAGMALWALDEGIFKPK
ncbi:MAG: DUF2019 domain-containing protein [Xanthobacteraceae bacterium]|nr:MAG: DUF2019 domain-containing protein [Xanthobacteraceae bacterium]